MELRGTREPIHRTRGRVMGSGAFKGVGDGEVDRQLR